MDLADVAETVAVVVFLDVGTCFRADLHGEVSGPNGVVGTWVVP